MTDFPDIAPPKQAWLITLADLALLLVGFLLLLQVTAPPQKQALARSFREAFGAEPPAAMPVAATAIRFAPGSAEPGDTAALVAWARDAEQDPRVAFSITGATDGSAADIDPASGSAALLASDRARAAAAALTSVVAPDRLRLATDPLPRGRAATVTLAFAGERP